MKILPFFHCYVKKKHYLCSAIEKQSTRGKLYTLYEIKKIKKFSLKILWNENNVLPLHHQNELIY